MCLCGSILKFVEFSSTFKSISLIEQRVINTNMKSPKCFSLSSHHAICILLMILISCVNSFAQTSHAFRNTKLSVEERVKQLLAELTIREKISLLGYNSPGVVRLGIPKYNWWSEALHGVARAGSATVFPQAI